jgi:glucokinase
MEVIKATKHRPARELGLVFVSSLAPLVLSVDIGGTKVEAALVRPDGTIVSGTRSRAPMTASSVHDPASDTGPIAEVIAKSMHHPLWSSVAAAAVGSAGPVDARSRTISPINLPHLRDYDVAGRVTKLTGLADVRVGLDGLCIALAEMWLGAARGMRNAMVMVVSTGVGGGVIADVRLIAGRTGNAGHIGQLLVETQGPRP